MGAQSNTGLIKTFYAAFGERDAGAMAACYAPNATFTDPAFGDLRGDQVRDMWRMLCSGGKDLKVEVSDVWADGESGGAHWNAWYTFATRRKVHNVVDAVFEFEDGLIIRHIDDFDFQRWAGQAFGIPGELLSKTPIAQFTVRRLARFQLDRYQDHKRKSAG